MHRSTTFLLDPAYPFLQCSPCNRTRCQLGQYWWLQLALGLEQELSWVTSPKRRQMRRCMLHNKWLWLDRACSGPQLRSYPCTPVRQHAAFRNCAEPEPRQYGSDPCGFFCLLPGLGAALNNIPPWSKASLRRTMATGLWIHGNPPQCKEFPTLLEYSFWGGRLASREGLAMSCDCYSVLGLLTCGTSSQKPGKCTHIPQCCTPPPPPTRGFVASG